MKNSLIIDNEVADTECLPSVKKWLNEAQAKCFGNVARNVSHGFLCSFYHLFLVLSFAVILFVEQSILADQMRCTSSIYYDVYKRFSLLLGQFDTLIETFQ